MAGTCSGSGPCDVHPLGHGKNWITKADPIGGLGPYIRAIANALLRSGHSEQEAVRLAVGIVRRWASGQGNVAASTRSRAAAALAHWESLRAKSHSHSREVTMTVDLASSAASMAARMMPDRAHVIALAKKVDKWPAGPRKTHMLAVIAARAKVLGMKPDGDGDFDYDVPAKADMARPANLGAPNAADLNTAARKELAAKGAALPGGRFPVRNRADLERAIKAVGRSKTAHAAIRRYLIRRAAALGLATLIPSHWSADGVLGAKP